MRESSLERGIRRVAPGLLAPILLFAAADRVHAQPSPGATGPDRTAAERPGLVRVGSFYVTPYLHVGVLGLDTNVFYSPTDRQTDFTASGGPGLEIVRPFGVESRFRLDGGLDYLYFAKTESQRKLNGYASALVDLQGVKTVFVAEERYARTFSRPSPQVDARVQQETEATRAFLKRRLGDRWRLVLSGARQRTTTDAQEYLGTNLGDTLTEERYGGGAELRLALTVKTSLVGGGEHSWYRFPRLPERDGQGSLAYGGLQTDETALLSGWALAGMRWFRIDNDPRGDRRLVYADIDATLNVSPRTKLGVRFRRDLEYSALIVFGPSPTLRTERVEVSLDKVLVSNIYLRLFARESRLVSDAALALEVPGEGPVRAVRADRMRDAGAELGYQFRSRIRIGLTAAYTERRSPIQTFGIEGLLAGLKIEYNSPQPTLR